MYDQGDALFKSLGFSKAHKNNLEYHMCFKGVFSCVVILRFFSMCVILLFPRFTKYLDAQS